MIKSDRKKTKTSKSGVKVYFNTTYDPQVPHPRKIISQNYNILARSEKAKKLFPRENLVASSKRLKNLGELLSPTVNSASKGQGGRRR